MVDEKSPKNTQLILRYPHDFESESTDPGIAYTENFHRRKIETISKADIFKALKNAATKGSSVENQTNIQFVRELLTEYLVFKTTKEQRKEVFHVATKEDIIKNKKYAFMGENK